MRNIKGGGVILIGLSCVVWIGAFIVPFIDRVSGVKWWLSGGLLILGEVLFWGGSIILGKGFLQRFLHHLRQQKVETRDIEE